MAAHNDFGKKGESLAAAWLLERGYALLHQNWKHSRFEIDIIAKKENILHFIEVKARRSNRFGFPEESVDKKKMQNLMNAAEAFQFRFPEWKRIQYDVLSVNVNPDGSIEFFFIEDVYL
jgi:putative endonuclease